MAKPENVYRLHVTAHGVDADGRLRLRVVLRQGDEAWEDQDPKATLTIPSGLLDRCNRLHRHPEDAVALMTGAGGARDPEPDRVENDLDRAASDDIGAWLWKQLPAPVRAELGRTLLHTTRLIVHAPSDASLLPWHRLAVWHAGAGHQPHDRDRWDVWMHVDGGDDADLADVQPRVLLLVGSQRLRPEANAAEHDVLAIARSILLAGFHCEMAAGIPTLEDIGVEGKDWHRLENLGHVLHLVRTGDYAIVHFVGHSDATRRLDQDGLGATRLAFEFEDPEEPKLLPILSLTEALRGRASVVVLHACMTRERMAATLLEPGGAHATGAVDAVVTMGAFAAPPACAAFAAGFYGAWRADQPWLDVAVAEGRRAMREQHPGLDWVPMLWTRTDQRLRLATQAGQILETYCRGVRLRHSRFDGLFAKHFDALFEKIVIDVQVSREREAGADVGNQAVMPRPQGGEQPSAQLPGGQLSGARLQVADLVLAGRRYTLGGVPGSGKTTMIRRLASNLARERQRAFVPIYLPLAQWLPAVPTEAADFAHAIGAFLQASYRVQGLAPVLEARAKDGGVVLLLDGVDELPPDLRGKLIELLEQVLLRDYAACPMLVATRRYETSKFLPQAWFGDADLQPLHIDRAKELLGNILSAHRECQDTAAGHVAWLGKEVGAGNRLWTEVASTPLLVSLLALQIVHGKLPATSRLQFFEQTFQALCRGIHRVKGSEAVARALPHHDDALPVLRYLAWRLTVAKVRTTTRAALCSWLVPVEGVAADAAGVSALAPPADVVAALGSRDKWRLPTDEVGGEQGDDDDLFGDDDAHTPAAAFLRAVARLTLIVGPQHTGHDAPWQFWHKSFQEALCALYLRERFLAKGRDAAAVEAMLVAFDGWVGTKPDDKSESFSPGAAAIERHRAELLRVFDAPNDRGGMTPAQAQIRNEAFSAPSDDPSARNVGLNEAWARYLQGPSSWAEFRDATVDVVARARAGLEAREAFLETFGLLGDALDDTHPLIDGLRRRDWQLAFRAALAANHVPPQSLRPLLGTLRELGQRAQVIEHATRRCRTGQEIELHEAMRQRAVDLQPVIRLGEVPPGTSDSSIEVWAAPGELGVLYRCSAQCGGSDVQATTRRDVIAVFSPPQQKSLSAQLHLVPGREEEREPGRSEAGIRLWRLIPAGEFEMGSADAGPRGDETRHRVQIAQPFWIGAVPVTVGLYGLFSPAHEVWTGNGYQRVGAKGLDPAMAVTNVSHHAARMFCAWLQHHAGAELLTIVRAQAGDAFLPVPEAIHVRLPFEAEWEYAARAGTSTRYFFGDDPQEKDLGHWAWFGEGPHAAAHPVASTEKRGANAFGLFDVHGNVWEWCEDWYAERYPVPEGGAIRTDLRGSASGRFRVLRGGSARLGADGCRAAARDRFEPGRNGNSYGFRVVLAAVPRSNIDP